MLSHRFTDVYFYFHNYFLHAVRTYDAENDGAVSLLQESSEVEKTTQLGIPRQCCRLMVICLSPVFTSHLFPI